MTIFCFFVLSALFHLGIPALYRVRTQEQHNGLHTLPLRFPVVSSLFPSASRLLVAF